MQALVRRVVPRPVRDALRPIAERYQALAYIGNNVQCPCCGAHWREFLPHGRPERTNARCAKCDSLERHRLIQLFLHEREPEFHKPCYRFLHFAPETVLRRFIEPRVSQYVSTDLMVGKIDLFSDITCLPYRDNTFDAILCVHILEHIPDDAKAIHELRRVLKPGGWAVLQVPLDAKRTETYEDWSITDPAERFRHFGQEDHCRIYGVDYYDRLRASDLQVHLKNYPESRQRFGITDEELCICTKPS